MKINIAKAPFFDSKLNQIDCTGLWFRNGIFYFRKMVKGKRFQCSLHTSDIFCAIYLAKQYREKLMPNIIENYAEEQIKFFLKELGPSFNIDYINRLVDPNDPAYYTKAVKILEKELEKKKDSVQQKITEADFWKKYQEYCNYYNGREDKRGLVHPESFKQKLLNKYEIVTLSEPFDGLQMRNLSEPPQQHLLTQVAEDYIKQNYSNCKNNLAETRHAVESIRHFVSFFPKDTTIEDIDKNPAILDKLIDGLRSEKIKSGKNAGRTLTRTTIKNKMTYFIAMIKSAYYNGLINNIDKIKNKLNVNKWKGIERKTSDEVVPFENKDYEKIYKFLKNIKDGNLSDIDLLKPNVVGGRCSELQRIKKHPKAFFYVVLLALCTGSRANACCTLRHQDIDIEENTIDFCKSNDPNDKRDKHKELKTDESLRKIPIPKFLIDNGFLEYLKHHEQYLAEHANQYLTDGETVSEAFIFEEAIRTKTSYRPSNINEAFNAFLIACDIKRAGSGKCKTFHSLKKSFYSHNSHENKIDKKILQMIAGNSTKNGDVTEDHYIIYRDEHVVKDIDRIKYPYQDILLT